MISLVELVDAEGTPVGSATVEKAHQAPGLRHRAFSVFVRDQSGRVLLQQRAAVKTRFPLRWGNTCCGHPAPGEALEVAAARRLFEELGIQGVPLTELGVYSYYAEDPTTGRIEYEYDHVLVGEVSADLAVLPDPDEVADVRWISLDDLRAALADDPRSYAPWLVGVTAVLASSSLPSPSLPSLSLPSPSAPVRSAPLPSPPSPSPPSRSAPSRSAPSPSPPSSDGAERSGGG